MTSQNMTVWKEPPTVVIPADAGSAGEIVPYAAQLTKKDQRQIVEAFNAQSYEMVAGFVLKKSFTALKRQLADLGMEFIGEMLGRPDIDEDSNVITEISDFEALTLARELGVITSMDAKRLSQSVELLAHFESLQEEEAETEEVTRDDALGILRTTVSSILGRSEPLSAPSEFLEFRKALEARTFKSSDSEVTLLAASPYFFQRTTMSILLAGTRSANGAAFEHCLGNVVVIVPVLWSNLKKKERWSVGQAYAEAVSAGNSAAATALKKALSEVQGFDFVPENLRSQTFSAAAGAVLNAHGGYNNFYNEPEPMRQLAKLGSTFPWPAFPVCMTAVLCVFLGNRYGVSHAAQASAEEVLTRVTANQWDYYLNECLPSDQLILSKLAWEQRPIMRWFELVSRYDVKTDKVHDSVVAKLVAHSLTKEVDVVAKQAEKLVRKQGP